MAASHGGDDHSAGSTCLTSYMKYRPSVRGAPASSVAKMPGWPSVGIFVTWSKPASLSMRIVSSQPSFTPRFSAAMDGCRIHSCRRATASSWCLSISVKIGARSSARRVAVGALGHARAAVAAAVRSRKVRRSTLMNGLQGSGSGQGREVSVPGGQNAADVTLEADVFNLEAVVVTGQATGVERRNAAIATTNVSGQEVSAVPAPSLDRALAGRVPGAIINQNSGAPGGGTQIQIRGNNTVIGNPDPLFVVDGVLYSDASLPTGLFTVTGSSANRGNGELQDDPVNRLADLNSGDIESVEVLRGAAAASIYGSKAANGVIIVKTNRGKAGKARATVTQRLGFFELQRGPATRSFTEAEALDLYASSAADAALIKSD